MLQKHTCPPLFLLQSNVYFAVKGSDLVTFCTVAPENASLSTNVSTVPVVCVGMVVNFTCAVEATNPAVDTFTLYENGSVISNKADSGVWIKTLDTGGVVTYRCQANNSVGTSSSSNKTRFSIEGEATVILLSSYLLPLPSLIFLLFLCEFFRKVRFRQSHDNLIVVKGNLSSFDTCRCIVPNFCHVLREI